MDNQSKQQSTSISEILGQRGNRYGDFYEHARITQNIKGAMVDSPNWAKLPPNMKEALEMLAHKVGRILNGDPYYDDSWIDIEGYIHLISKELSPPLTASMQQGTIGSQTSVKQS